MVRFNIVKSKKIVIGLVFSFFLFSSYVLFDSNIIVALQPNTNKVYTKDGKEFEFRYLQNDAFGYGEKLDYKVIFSFITAGEGYFHILPKKIYRGNNRECYDIRFQVNSLKSLEWIYKVTDNYRTVLDAGGIFPWEFEQKIREGNYKRDFRADFDHVNNKVYAKDTSYNIDRYTHDIVSAFFYVRTLNLSAMPKNHIFYLKNFFDDTTYNLGVKIHGKQNVTVEAGKFRCIVIEPLVVEGGLFKSEGQILIWVTDDDRKIPVKVATKILIGYVSAELISYRGLRGPLKSKLD